MKLMQKTLPKPLKKTLKSNPKTDAGKYRKISPTISPTLRFGVPFWSLLHDLFPGWRVFLPICFSEPSRAPPRVILETFWTDFGPPLTDFGLPWGTLGPILSTFWKMPVADLLQISKIPEQPLSPTKPSKNKQRFKSSLPTIHPITSFYLFISFYGAA